MSGLIGRWPDGFVPEKHGWVKQRSKGLSDVWVRWEIPFRFPASISRCLSDGETSAVGGWYMGPVDGRYDAQATQAEVHAELLRTDLNELNRGGPD